MSDLTPLPGDPGDIKAEARRLSEAAADMRSAAKRIRNLTNFGGYSSAAVAAATKKADGIHEGLEVAETRYSRAASALATWADELEEAQRDADRAIAKHEAASTELRSAQGALSSAQAEARNQDLSDHETTTAQYRVSYASNRVCDAQSDQATARSEYEQARWSRDTAASKAATAIQQCNKTTNDTFSSQLDAAVGNTLTFLKDALDVFSTIITVLLIAALVVVFIVGTGGAAAILAAGLLSVLTMTGLLSAAVASAQASRGERDLGSTLTELMFAIPAVGKLGKILKGLRPGAKTHPNSVQRGMDIERGKKVDGGRHVPRGQKGERTKYGNRIFLEGLTDITLDMAGKPLTEAWVNWKLEIPPSPNRYRKQPIECRQYSY